MLVALKKQYCDDNDFDYAKPANITSANQDDQVDRKPSKLTLPDTLSEFFNSKLKTSPESAKDVTYYGLVHLSDEDIQALPLEQQERILESNMLLHIPDTILTNFIRNFLLKKKLKKETFTLSENVYNNLTIDQLLALKKSIPELLTNQQYLNAWFNRNLCRPIANTGDFEDLSHEERVDKL